MRHTSRSTYSVPVPRILAELAPTNGKCPHFAPLVSDPAIPSPAIPNPADEPQPEIKFMFGRMFDEQPPTIEVLTQLGTRMDAGISRDSINHSGYTYLGQFIAHEITFDQTRGLPAAGALLNNYRSPQIDLDSLYGSDGDPIKGRIFRDDGQSPLLNIGLTVEEPNLIPEKRNDLFRDETTGKAIIADERNDENLALAQVQVAFMSFHNKLVERLREEGVPDDQLRERARAEVVKHFQWIVLYDFLATMLDQDVLREVIDDVLNDRPLFYKPDPAAPFMPLEFSAAAFRMGHSMVRSSYEWNYVHSPELNGNAVLKDLFRETHFSGFIKPEIRTPPRLQSRWIIDWRRFFDFNVITNDNGPIYAAPPLINRARRIDTTIDLTLATVDTGFNHEPFEGAQRSLAVRNLLRGYALGLPTGEDVAELMGEEDRLTADEIAAGFEDSFNSHWLKGKTPLWFYILREAEIRHNGDRLGKVGSRIVAETLVTLIKNSDYSIFNNDGWQPRSSRFGPAGQRIFQMVDLLHSAGVVNPINL